MYRISAIIEEAFSANLKLAEKHGIGFDIDFPDPTLRIDRPSLVRTPLNKFLPEAMKRAQKKVSLGVSKREVVIRDDGVALSPTAIKEMNEFDNVTIKSRVGFGTEIRIKFT